MKPLHLKYRPRSLRTVIGQDVVVKALQHILAKKSAHSFLFCGPSGCGKTTLARIAARELGANENDWMEIDAATFTGVDAMRSIKQAVQYQPLGGGAKAVILDECHSLSKQAWQSLLKVTEEPPEHAYFFFCTTEPAKVPTTIKTRAAAFTLKDVDESALLKLVKRVCAKEGIELADGVADVVVRQSNYSPRQALVNLQVAANASNKKEAMRLLEAAIERDAIRELCRHLLAGGSWARVKPLLTALEDENPESVRIVVLNYVTAVLKNSKSDRQAQQLLHIMDCFSQPFNASERMAPLYLAVGQVLLAR